MMKCISCSDEHKFYVVLRPIGAKNVFTWTETHLGPLSDNTALWIISQTTAEMSTQAHGLGSHSDIFIIHGSVLRLVMQKIGLEYIKFRSFY